MSALNKQVDGNHYKNQVVQPFELAYLVAGGDAGFCKFVKYLTRDKGDRKVNLEKAIHVTELKAQMVLTFSLQPIVISPQNGKLLQLATGTLDLTEDCDFDTPKVILLALYTGFLVNDFETCIEVIKDMIEELEK
jgi:hypothetical protein